MQLLKYEKQERTAVRIKVYTFMYIREKVRVNSQRYGMSKRGVVY